MNKQKNGSLKLGLISLMLVAMLVLTAFLAACSCSNGPDPTYPDPTYADKSNLPYISSLDSYKKTDWEGCWIWEEVNASDTYVAFRKTFKLDATPDKVTANIAASDKYFMWVNGELVVYDGCVKRGPTLYDTYYDEVELSGLKSGENTLAFLVVYNGRQSESALDAGSGGFLFEAKAGDTLIKSDHTFKAKRLGEYKNQSMLKGDYPNYKQASMLGERNVYYDARDSAGDFTARDFDDSDWKSATPIAKAGAQPFNDLYIAATPPIAFDDITDFENAGDYVGKTLTEKTTLELELTHNRQFSTCFELESEAGKSLVFYTDTYNVGNEPNFKDTYITKSGMQCYENYPWRSGSKLYIEAPAGVKFTKLGYRASGYDSETSGSFICDDNDLNVLWTKALNTLQINMRDSFMDCPDRERAPYMGDATNQIDMVFYSLDANSHKMVKKAILAEIGWTQTDNVLPSRVPSKTAHEIPAQSLAFITAVYNYYLYTGDAETVKLFYPIMAKYLRVWELQSDGLIKIRQGTWRWTDWGANVDEEVIQNCWYYYALDCAESLATAFGITADNDFYAQRKSSIKTNFANVYKQPDGSFRSGSVVDDRANALAVVSGLAVESDYPAIKTVLATTTYASPYMEKYVLQALCEMGEYEAAYERMRSRYSAMIASDTTTLWELWSLSSASSVSVNHGWTGGPMVIMGKYFAGIRPTGEGYKTYEICPQNLFDNMSCTVGTPEGKISISVKSTAGGFTMTINTIKANGTLVIPESYGTDVTVTGGAYTSLGGNSFSLSGGSYVVTIR